MYQFLKLLFCIVLMNFADVYFIDILKLIGINLNTYSILTKELLFLGLYIIILIIIFFCYKSDIKRDFRRFKHNIFPNILMILVFFIVVTLSVKVIEYISFLIVDNTNITLKPVALINIFNESLNINTIIILIKNILIIPFIGSIVYILGVDELIKNKNKGIILSGLLAAIFIGINIEGSLLVMIISAIPYFILYSLLAWIYYKNNNNIWFASITLILYSLLASVLIAKIL